jgi:hypothetical protein
LLYNNGKILLFTVVSLQAEFLFYRHLGPKRDEVTGEWRKLHNEELIKDLYSTQYCAGDKIEKNEMGRACSAYVEGRGVYRVLVGKPEGKRSLGRPRRR